MRYSKAFVPTLKEVPKDATTPSHVLLLRGGFVRMIGSGIYEMLPLGRRVLAKIERTIRREMDDAGAQEVLMPALLPAEYFQETGRYDSFGGALFRLKDRKGAEYNLGPTHEEIITDMVRRDVKSYRQLPLNLYQIQMKFRDEPRPRAGILRCREFLMKDAYSFDVDEAHALESYAVMRAAYHRIFKHLGLDYRVVDADSGAMGGSTSAEFQVLVQTGEDALVVCSSCDYAANVEVAETTLPTDEKDTSDSPAAEKLHTPGVGSIEDVVAFLAKTLPDISAARMLKSLLYLVDEKLVMAVVRGDDDLNEIRLARTLGVDEVFMASEEDVKKATGAAVGFAGPVGFEGEVIIDPAAAAVTDAITGANETDRHLVHVRHGRDFEARVESVRMVKQGDPCPKCSAPLESYRGIEGGHVFVLGTHYSKKMGATFLDPSGEEKPVVMGCYGIGVSRLMAAAIEQHHDDDGIIWPMSIAPYQVILTPLGKAAGPLEAAEALYEELRVLGVEALLDDRAERPGVKFKDADLLGIPLRVTIGQRGLDEGLLELKRRDAKDAEKLPIAEMAARVATLVTELGGELTPRSAKA
ncbi:MAG: proline--tRNA ligase [Deltaproteobacteria bacterium]|nr:proline--tRNA ligase [Deltaproteobacteria bacterium]